MDELNQFHFLRPLWLLMIPLLVVFTLWLHQQQRQRTGFEQWIDNTLLPYISTGSQSPIHSTSYLGLIAIWIITTIALAGPTWKQLPQPLHESEATLIIVLDLSPSMRAEDNKPSRIVRARLKIKDLLNQRKEGLTALVVYAGEAHIVTPLTDDTHTIINLLATLEPGLLPIPGSNIEMAVDLSKELLRDSDLKKASLVVVTDGIDSSAFSTLKRSIGKHITLFILGVGTSKGAPIPTRNGFLRDDSNNMINSTRNDAQLKAFAQSVQGTYLPLQADDSDIRFILDTMNKPTDQSRELEHHIDRWHEWGPTLLLFLLPLLAFTFRRGWLLVLVVTVLPVLPPKTAHAFSWDDLWLNDNQQGQQAFEQEQYEKAEQSFDQPQWKGSAAYRNKNYTAAVKAFGQGNTATDHYNRGNALAQLGQLDKAIEAYDTALAINPELQDAITNKKIIENFQQQQQQQQQNNHQEQHQDQQQNSDSGSNSDNNSDNSQKQSQNNSLPKEQQSQQSTSSRDSTQNQQEEQKKADNTESKKAEQQRSSEENKSSEDSQPENASLTHLSKEEKQALEQWIRKIHDDPSGLLRRKFDYEFKKRRREYNNGQWELPDNNAHKRY
ncbi:hypothetical protein AB835_08955 [Candidatus Endobugula sertula]|uniref:VWFA domain-containing protein n=1 Tax=Candidatus Endobugula sertula TaxID=62101 RepID=A0A1D2QPC3_9GAMM|nr:hypothetical protein AB835_08955 [Candidatus Endobugula sertula]